MLVGLGVVVFLVVPSILVLEVLRCVYLEWRGDRIPILLYHRLVSRKAVRAGRIPDREPIYAIHDDTFDGTAGALHRCRRDDALRRPGQPGLDPPAQAQIGGRRRTAARSVILRLTRTVFNLLD